MDFSGVGRACGLTTNLPAEQIEKERTGDLDFAANGLPNAEYRRPERRDESAAHARDFVAVARRCTVHAGGIGNFGNHGTGRIARIGNGQMDVAVARQREPQEHHSQPINPTLLRQALVDEKADTRRPRQRPQLRNRCVDRLR